MDRDVIVIVFCEQLLLLTRVRELYGSCSKTNSCEIAVPWLNLIVRLGADRQIDSHAAAEWCREEKPEVYDYS
jgi:hypothetical protein